MDGLRKRELEARIASHEAHREAMLRQMANQARMGELLERVVAALESGPQGERTDQPGAAVDEMCANCKFFRPWHPEAESGHCHRNPPWVVAGADGFPCARRPEVEAEDFCGWVEVRK